MLVLGCDPGITTGLVSIEFDPNTDHWYCQRRWEFRAQTDDPCERLFMLAEELHANLAVVHEVAMEELLAYRKASMDEAIESRAVIKLAAYEQMVNLFTYAPTTIRSVVMGHGKATPKEIRDTMRFLLRLPKTCPKGEKFTAHQQDALAVALCHAVRAHGLVLDRTGERAGKGSTEA